jgi:hypothetical protein
MSPTGDGCGATFDTDLAAAVDGLLFPNSAVLFTPNAGDHIGQTFLVVDADGDGSYQAGNDFVILPLNPMGAVGSPDFFV